MTLEIARRILIGFMIGGGIGAKIGAYISQLAGASESWDLVEFGILFGSAVGICIAGAIALYKSGVFTSNEEISYSSNTQILVGQ